MTPDLRLAPSPTTVDKGAGASRNPLVHAENPDRPGYALCGRRLKGTASSLAAGICVVCEDLTRPSYWMR